ncbi:unnamed protein product [Ilex paraguariensis]|uniref:Terpene synthase N-terminal domain-containing protein n=1 Tax=Ilex paraguariensis TaxID=185542 RepID=A0ABC8UEL8_9AQUA
MALQALFSPFLVSTTLLFPLHSSKIPVTLRNSKSTRCVANVITVDDHTITRRSANYLQSVWDYDFVQSLTSDYNEEKYVRQVDKLKDDVKCLINGVMDPLAKLELIDVIQRLGLKYLFETEIKKALDIIYKDSNIAWLSDDLFAIALRFRLLRQHGYNVPQGKYLTVY